MFWIPEIQVQTKYDNKTITEKRNEKVQTVIAGHKEPGKKKYA